MVLIVRTPRTVRWQAAFATWRLFGLCSLVALAMTVGIALTMLVRDDFRLPQRDWRLDAAPTVAEATGEVLAADSDRARRKPQGVRYRYAFTGNDGQRREDSSWSGRELLVVGEPVPVEFLPDDPSQSRIRGLHYAGAAVWLPTYAGVALLPAVLAVALWLVRVYQTLALLRHGKAAPARLLSRGPARRRPPHVRVAYEFTADDGRTYRGRQQVRVGSDLERALASAAVGAELPLAAAIYAEGHPRRCRLVAGSDVAESGA